MITLFGALAIPILEYCCQLWTQFTLGTVWQLEGVQQTFASRVRGMEQLNYWERLKRLQRLTAEEPGDVCQSVHMENDNWNGPKL
jgi:hypothetical protein